MCSLWNTSLAKIESFVEKANNFHSTIKFTAEMSKTEISLSWTQKCTKGLDQIQQGIYPGVRSIGKSGIRF